MPDTPDADAVWPQILNAFAAGNTDQVQKLLWPPGATPDWFDAMAPMMEMRGDGYAKSDRELAIFCYEQARALYQADSAGATSGGEGMAGMSEMRGSHLGRKIWLLKS